MSAGSPETPGCERAQITTCAGPPEASLVLEAGGRDSSTVALHRLSTSALQLRGGTQH